MVGCGFSLGVRKGEGGRFEGITRGSIQGQKRIPPSLPSKAQRWPRDNGRIDIKVSFRWPRMSGSVGRWGDVNVGVRGCVPPVVAEWLGW